MSTFYKSYHPYVKPEADKPEPEVTNKFKKKYTESEFQTISRMRKNGASWDECGAEIGRTGESCYKAMKNRTYRTNKALKSARQAPSVSVIKVETDRILALEHRTNALTVVLALVAVMLVLNVVGVI